MVPNYISNPRTLLSIREVYPQSPKNPDPRVLGALFRDREPEYTAVPDSPCARAAEEALLRVCCLAPLDDSSCLPGTHGFSFSSQVRGPHASMPNPAVWRGTSRSRPMIMTGGAGDMFRCSSHPGNGGLLVLHPVEPYTRSQVVIPHTRPWLSLLAELCDTARGSWMCTQGCGYCPPA